MNGDETRDRLRDWFETNFRQNATRPAPTWVRASHVREKLDAIGIPCQNKWVGEEMARLGFSQDAFRIGPFVARVWSFGEATKDDDEIVLGRQEGVTT